MNIPTRLTLPAAFGAEGTMPKGLTLVNAHPPRLSSDGPITVAAVEVHHTKEEWILEGSVMIDRVRKADGLPVDSIEDIRTILSRGLVCPCDYLMTGLEVCSAGGAQWPLILCKDKDGRWQTEYFSTGSLLSPSAVQVLCYDPDASK